VLKHKFTT